MDITIIRTSGRREFVEQCSLSFENHTTNQFASGSTERQNEIWNDVIPKDHTSVRPPQQHGPLIITEKLDSSPNTTLASNKNGFTGLKHKHSLRTVWQFDYNRQHWMHSFMPETKYCFECLHTTANILVKLIQEQLKQQQLLLHRVWLYLHYTANYGK